MSKVLMPMQPVLESNVHDEIRAPPICSKMETGLTAIQNVQTSLPRLLEPAGAGLLFHTRAI